MKRYHAIYDYPACEEFQPYDTLDDLFDDEAAYFKRNHKYVDSKILEIDYQNGTERLIRGRELDRLLTEYEKTAYERACIDEYGSMEAAAASAELEWKSECARCEQ